MISACHWCGTIQQFRDGDLFNGEVVCYTCRERIGKLPKTGSTEKKKKKPPVEGPPELPKMGSDDDFENPG